MMAVASELVRNALSSATAGVWICSIAWVIADARSRLPKARQVHAATAVVALLPVAGLLAWLAARPRRTLTERWAGEIRGALFADAAETGECPVCRTELDPDYRTCPDCGLELEEPCEACGAPVQAMDDACPCCGRPARDAKTMLRAAAH